MDEVDQIDAEPKGNEVKLLLKVSNDSGHPSSRNYSVTSGMSDSPSTEDSGMQEMSTKTSTQESVMQDNKKDEYKTEKMEKTIMEHAGGESEKAEMEDLDTVKETLQQVVSMKSNEVKVDEHAEAAEGFEGIVHQVRKYTKVEDKRRKTEVSDEAGKTEQEEKSGLLVSVLKGEKRDECVGREQIKGSDTRYSPGVLKTTFSKILNTSATIKTDETQKIQTTKAEPSEKENDSRPMSYEAQRAAEAPSPSLVKGKGQSEAVRRKVTMPSAPVVKEIVVPVVFEAFSTREMSKETPATDSDESPSAIEMEEIPVARLVGVQKGREALLPEMETLYPQFESHAVTSEKNTTTTPVPPTGTTYTVHILFIGIDLFMCDTQKYFE